MNYLHTLSISLLGWTLALGPWVGCGGSSEDASREAKSPEAEWPRELTDSDAIELRLAEAPGRVMGQRERARVQSGPMPLFSTVPDPKASRRVDPRQPGPPLPGGAGRLAHQTGSARPRQGASSGFAVIQHAPEGEVERPREIRLRFSEDVAGILAGAVMDEIPIEIRPDIRGQWRWLDPRTLTFRPSKGAGFLPATTYEVELAAALHSSKGEKLREGRRWRFTVGGPQIVGTWPSAELDGEGDGEGATWPRNTPILIAFDRAVDIDRLLPRLALTAAGKAWPLRLLRQEERDEAVRAAGAVAHWPATARLVAVQPITPLPASAEATLLLSADDASADDEASSILTFRTRPAFAEAKLACAWAPSPFVRAEFSLDARLDPGRLSPSDLSFAPALSDVSFAFVREERGELQGRSILAVTGRAPPAATSLKATLRAGVRDREGVASATDITATCDLPEAAPRAWPARTRQVSAEGKLWLHATGPTQLGVRAFPIPPEQRLGDFRIETLTDLTPALTQTVEIAPTDFKASIDLGALFDDRERTLLVELTDDTDPIRFAWLERAPTLLFAEQSNASVVALAVSALDGLPQANVELQLVGAAKADTRQATTDANGIARFEDVTFDARRVEAGSTFATVERPAPKPYLLSPILAHRPGDELELAGIVSPVGEARRIQVELADSSTSAPLDDAGRFQVSLRVPKGLSDGALPLQIFPIDDRERLVGQTLSTRMPVGQWQRGKGAAMHLEAVAPEAISGEPLLFQLTAANEHDPLDWRVTSNTVALGFDDLPGFVFGDGLRPWARLPAWIADLEAEDICQAREDSALSTLFPGVTVTARTPGLRPVEVTARVRPEGSPARPAQAHGLSKPGSRLVGIRTERSFFRQGEWAALDVLAVDAAGQIAPGHDVSLEVFVQETKPWLGGFRPLTRRVFSRTLRSGTVPSTTRLQLVERALYRVIAAIRDDQGRLAKSEIALWVDGAFAPPPLPSAGAPKAELFFEPGHGGVGNSGELLARLHRLKPRPTAAWIVWESADGRLWPRPIRLPESDGAAPSFSWRLTEVSGVLASPPVAAHLITFDGTKFARSPKHLFAGRRREAEADLSPSIQRGRASRRGQSRVIRDAAPLSVGVRATDDSQQAFEIEVRDALGAPVADAELLVAIFDAGREAEADEAWSEIPSSVADHGFSLAQRADFSPPEPIAAQVCTAPDQEKRPGRSPKPWPVQSSVVEQRWLQSDRAGRAILRRPSSNLRLRVSAFDRKFERHAQASVDLEARAQSQVRAQLDLPPFARPDDRIVARFALDNPLPREVRARLDLKAAGAQLPEREASREMTLPPHARWEIAVPLKFDVGTPSLALSAQVRALDRVQNLQGSVAVIPELTETRAAGVLPKGPHATELVFSRAHRTRRGELEIALASEEILGLQDAFDALFQKPALTLEARIARLFALGALGSDGVRLLEPDSAAREALWRRAIEEVDALILRDEHGDDAPAFLELFALDALLRLKSGAPDRFAATHRARLDAIVDAARPALAQLSAPAVGASEADDALRAYALHLRHRLGDRLEEVTADDAKALATRLFGGATGEPLAWLLLALQGLPEFDALAQAFEGRMIGDAHADSAHLASAFAFQSDGQALFHAEHRADGVAIDALRRLKRAPRLVERLERGLMSHHMPGHGWASLQENAWAIAALAPRLRAPTTDTTARAWLDGFLGERRVGRGGQPIARWRVPLDFLPANAERRTLVLDNRGAVDLAYRIVRRWNDPREDVLSEGISLSRALEPDGSGRVERGVKSDLLVRAGRVLRATHALHLPACQHGLVVRSPLPAGLAALASDTAFHILDCQGRPARVRAVRAKDATEFHIDEAGIGEHTIEELWLATHRGEFDVPAASVRIEEDTTETGDGVRCAVGGHARLRVE
ncbi:MAG: hypothetical protein LBM75_08655 [Myxococcales bacterium]|jgi:hypothetical protein|nr:hypothetical protein [Myxococcales bacterium]